MVLLKPETCDASRTKKECTTAGTRDEFNDQPQGKTAPNDYQAAVPRTIVAEADQNRDQRHKRNRENTSLKLQARTQTRTPNWRPSNGEGTSSGGPSVMVKRERNEDLTENDGDARVIPSVRKTVHDKKKRKRSKATREHQIAHPIHEHEASSTSAKKAKSVKRLRRNSEKENSDEVAVTPDPAGLVNEEDFDGETNFSVDDGAFVPSNRFGKSITKEDNYEMEFLNQTLIIKEAASVPSRRLDIDVMEEEFSINCHRNIQNDESVSDVHIQDNIQNDESDCDVQILDNIQNDGSDDSDVQILDNAAIETNGVTSVFVPSRIFVRSSDDENQDFGGPSTRDDFRRRVLEVLNRPYDEDEYLRHKHTVLAGNYFHPYPDLEKKLVVHQYDKRKCLAILRGFFFWLQNVVQDGAFKPWKDGQCLKVRPS